MYPVSSAVTETAIYPAASLSPIASPRCLGPARSIFMITVVDQVRPWLIPSNTLANTTQPQTGAQISSSGTGSPMSHPATSIGLRPSRSDKVPATKLVTAFTNPKATMKVIATVIPVRPNSSFASSGRTVRSWPNIPPTKALTTTNRVNWARLARRPSRILSPFGAGIFSGDCRQGRRPLALARR